MKQKNKKFIFHSFSSPCEFLIRIKNEAVESDFKIEQNGNDFNLQIGSNHGGEVVYKATIVEDENGGSFIRGEIVTVP